MSASVTKKNKKIIPRKHLTNIWLYVALIALAALTIVPFIMALSISIKGENEAIFSMPPQLLPDNFTLDNYLTVWNTIPIPRYLLNSILITFFGVILPLILSALAAFPLARMKFRGRQFIFIMILATMMIPGEVTMIPVYLIIDKLNLMGTYSGVILPGAISVLGIFLMRQAFMNIPKEVEESAVIDGANTWQVFFKIMLPMVKPMLGTLAILSFINSWNSFLWPLLILQDESMYPLTVGLYKMEGTFVANTRLIASGALIAMAPIIVIFVWLQRYFIDAAISSSVKG